MAFTCRTEEKHEEALQDICHQFNFATKQKALLYIVENFAALYTDRNAKEKRIQHLESELHAIKNAIRNKLRADEDLKNCINEGNPKIERD